MRRKRKKCPLEREGLEVDYKDVKLLQKFMTEGHKILPARVTALSRENQALLSLHIKRARYLALVPYHGQGVSS